MNEKKGLLSGLLGGKKEKNGCCNMEIVEVETECNCSDSCCAPETDTEQKQTENPQESV
jgi:hypothetical protein